MGKADLDTIFVAKEGTHGDTAPLRHQLNPRSDPSAFSFGRVGAIDVCNSWVRLLTRQNPQQRMRYIFLFYSLLIH